MLRAMAKNAKPVYNGRSTIRDLIYTASTIVTLAHVHEQCPLVVSEISSGSWCSLGEIQAPGHRLRYQAIMDEF